MEEYKFGQKKGYYLEGFTESTIRVMVFAKEQCQRFRARHLGDEHILLGILFEGYNSPANYLLKKGLSFERAIEWVKQISGMGIYSHPSKNVELNNFAQKAIELAYKEAINLNNNYVGIEHLLMGIAGEDGLGAALLKDYGINKVDIFNDLGNMTVGVNNNKFEITKITEANNNETILYEEEKQKKEYSKNWNFILSDKEVNELILLLTEMSTYITFPSFRNNLEKRRSLEDKIIQTLKNLKH